MNWLQSFIQIGQPPANSMYGEYNLYIVLLSYIIATIASYVALDMSAHLRRPTTPLFFISWLAGGAFVMGAGIWSMHFIGMLAFIMPMPMPMTYDLFWTGLSMLVAVIAAAIAFLFFKVKSPNTRHYLVAGIILGAAIPTMHYTGMAGMNGVKIHYLPGLFALSILVAVIAATVALWLSVQSDKGSFGERVRLKFVSAAIMGFAIAGMHYIGMAAAVFTHSEIPKEASGNVLSLDPIIMSVIIATIVMSIMIVALVLSTARFFSAEKNVFLMAILDNMREGVITCDDKGKIILFNHAAEEAFGDLVNIGNSPTEWTKKYPIFKMDGKEQYQLEEYPLYRALKGENLRDMETIIYDQKGNKHILLVDGKPLTGGSEEKLGGIIVWHDISKRIEDEEELKFRATHDSLTALPNRLLLLIKINQALTIAKQFHLKVVVIFLDLDNFKFINDALGHTIGDALLKMVGIRFKSLLRTSDTLARVGGDEFVIILPDQKNINGVQALLKKILDSISEPYLIEGHELNITCSIGFSVFPEDGTDAETLLKNSDAAMYQAKGRGRNAFQFYTKEMHTQVKQRLDIENGLRKALTNNEFILEYQPKLDIRTNKIIGLEALVRWKNPVQGLIHPNDFIPIAEDTGLIIPIGMWVLRTACAQNKAWQLAGLPSLCVSVNLSSRQCKDKNLVQIIEGVLAETGLLPPFLEIELTESLAMSSPKDFIKILSQFKRLGIKTSIDDFGSGYSSLNYLRQFPVNSLKIDQSFIKELETRPDDLSVVKAIISLGHSLNLRIIAEGVETKVQLLKLKENNCDEIQGNYFSPPLPSNDIPSFFEKIKNPYY